MTEAELIQAALEKMREYCRTYTPKERFARMVASGIINSEGQVLITKAEREAGHPIDDEPTDSQNGAKPLEVSPEIQADLEKIRAYCQKYTPKERFALMVASGIINSEGQVLMTKEERAAGHPIDDEPTDNGRTK